MLIVTIFIIIYKEYTVANLYYFNKFKDKMKLVENNVNEEDCIGLIIDFYYKTEMDVFYGNIKEVDVEYDVSGWPNDVERVYYTSVDSKEQCFFTFLVASEALARTYNKRSSRTYEW